VLSDEYSQPELDDALEVIAWLAAQSWCSGVVGMMGISWGGFNALQVAALRPPALKAIITLCSTDDRYRDDVHYMGGAKLNAGFPWAAFLFGAVCRPPDPALVGERWRSMWRQRLEAVPLFMERWLRHQRRDAYWRHGSVCEDYAAIECPVYAIGGWTDGYTNAIPRLLAHLNAPRKGLIGPWAHAYPHFASPGPRIGFLQEALRWWDHWLKGIDTGVMEEPMLRAWMTDSVRPAPYHAELPGRWVAEPFWPSSAIQARYFQFADIGLVAGETSSPNGLTPRPVCSPHSVGRDAGNWCPFGAAADQAGDQRADDAQSLIFETPPLDQAIESLGAPVVMLEISSDRPLAQLAVRLCDVHPDDASLRVSFGLLNLTHRDASESPSPLVPGQRYQVRIQLNDAGCVFPAGHRIRVALSTTYWPMMWPSPENATVTVFAGTIALPVRPSNRADDMLSPLPPPETATPDRPTEPRPGVARIERLGLELGVQRAFQFTLDGDDPLSAAAETTQTQTIARDSWRIRIETHMRMSCTSDMFVLRATARAWEGEAEISHRDWHYDIPRDLR
jgi:putative CocE/NonD family hydrolase